MGFGLGVPPGQRAIQAQIDEEMLALLTQLTNEINWYMRERHLTRAHLAERMAVSAGRVSQILNGGENLTLRTLAALSTALDARFDIELHALKAEDTYTGKAEDMYTSRGSVNAVNRRLLPPAWHPENAR